MSSQVDDRNGDADASPEPSDADTSPEPPGDDRLEDDPAGCDSFEGVKMTITLPDPVAAQKLLRCLAQEHHETSFTVDCVAMDGTHPCTVTLDHISEKQLEAAMVAVDAGYYDDPKDVSLSEIASMLGISESGTSQRLRGLERKLVRALVESCG